MKVYVLVTEYESPAIKLVTTNLKYAEHVLNAFGDGTLLLQEHEVIE